jgi:hypothetical protein
MTFKSVLTFFALLIVSSKDIKASAFKILFLFLNLLLYFARVNVSK